MAQNEYQSAAGSYEEALRTVRGVKNFFFGVLAAVILFLAGAFCLVRYAGVLSYENRLVWDNWLNWAFPFSAFLGVVVGFLYVLTLLIGLKISLAGRLERPADLTKGFFCSLLFLAILLPWQHILVHKVAGGEIPVLRTVPGVLYGFDELKQKAVLEAEQAKLDVFKEVLLAVRFILYPLAALLLLIVAQNKYRPQRVETPKLVTVSRPTERRSQTSQ